MKTAESPAGSFRTRPRRAGLHLVDLNCLAYVALVGLGVFLFRGHVPSWQRELAVHGGMLLVILAILRLHAARPGNRIVSIARLIYPLGCLAYAWNELDRLVPMAFGSYWASGTLLWADRAIFGMPPVVWCQAHYRPWLDELMNICYSGYYLFMPLVCLPLLLRGKRRELLFALSIATFTYFADFVLFYLFPALSPRMIPGVVDPRQADYTGYLFASFTRMAQANGAIHGGCFPSSHVAGAVAWTFVASKVNRRLAIALAPLAAGVVLATVYLRYHHAVDSIAGVAVGLACTRIAAGILRRTRSDLAIVLETGAARRRSPVRGVGPLVPEPAPAICYDQISYGILHPSRCPHAQPEGDRPLDSVREAHRRDRGLGLG
jgi:membrane-associated phospholipid phosphatase